MKKLFTVKYSMINNNSISINGGRGDNIKGKSKRGQRRSKKTVRERRGQRKGEEKRKKEERERGRGKGKE